MGKLDLRHYISHELWSPAKLEIAIRERGRERKGEEREEGWRKGREEICCKGNECSVSTSLLTISTVSDRLPFYSLYILLKDGISF